MNTVLFLYIWIAGVFGALILFWLYLRNQDKPPQDNHGHSPAE